MNITATPIAILISGILIFYGLLLVSNSQDEYYYYLEERTHANDTKHLYLFKTHKETGYSCYVNAGNEGYNIYFKSHRVVTNNIDFGHNLWSCAEQNNQDD